MLDIKSIRKNLPAMETAAANRGDTVDWEALVALDDRRKEDLQAIETLRHRRNVASEEIARMKKAGQAADQPMADMRAVGRHDRA